MIRRRVIVHGAVQGVGFRYWTRHAAHRHGVTGWVRNLADGSVEAQLEGDEASVVAMLDWLSHGPPTARVRSIDVTEARPAGDSAFRIAE